MSFIEDGIFNIVKKVLFYDKIGTSFPTYKIKEFDGKNYLNTNDEEFIENYCLYSNTDDMLFGLKNYDIGCILNCIRKAKRNEIENIFPDFIFENGFIEHFKITSSKETRKGSEEIKNLNLYKKEVRTKNHEFFKLCEATPSFDKVRSITLQKDTSESNYENLKNSFYKNFQKHINSLENYQGNKDIKIFLIEYLEHGIEMMEKLDDDLYGFRVDYNLKQEHFWTYRLSRDKNMLKYIYSFKDKIDYIIYLSIDGIEIIKVENIPVLLKCLKNDYYIAGIITKEYSKTLNITTKNNFEEINE